MMRMEFDHRFTWNVRPSLSRHPDTWREEASHEDIGIEFTAITTENLPDRSRVVAWRAKLEVDAKDATLTLAAHRSLFLTAGTNLGLEERVEGSIDIPAGQTTLRVEGFAAQTAIRTDPVTRFDLRTGGGAIMEACQQSVECLRESTMRSVRSIHSLMVTGQYCGNRRPC